MSPIGWPTERGGMTASAVSGGGEAAEAVSGGRLRRQLAGCIRDQRVLAAMGRVARERFLDASLLPFAGNVEAALPIAGEQTTSAPLIIAQMLEVMLAGRRPPLKILEIGSGSGYQTALLAEMGCEVVGVERLGVLVRFARRRLREMGYNAAEVRHADGYAGAPDAAPFDGIVVCAECAAVPPAWPAQLTEEGRLVLPLARAGEVRLAAVDSAGTVFSWSSKPVRFVDMRKGTA